jgi:hypothetical protein
LPGHGIRCSSFCTSTCNGANGMTPGCSLRTIGLTYLDEVATWSVSRSVPESLV